MSARTPWTSKRTFSCSFSPGSESVFYEFSDGCPRLVNLLGDRVLLSDPAWGNRTMRRQRFEDSWIEFPEIGKTGFVIQRQDGVTPPNRLDPRPSDFVMLR